MIRRRTTFRFLAAVTVGSLTISACGGLGSEPTQSAPSAAGSQVNHELADQLPADIRKSGEITIATPYGNPPSIFAGPDGRPEGAAYDLGQEIAAILGVKAVWREVAFPGVIPGLQAGKFDLSMGVIGDTPARQPLLDFVDLMAGQSNLLVKAGNPEKLSSVEKACGMTIGAMAGGFEVAQLHTASDACATQGKGDITIKEYPSTPDGQAQLQAGRIDGYFAPYIVVGYTARTAAGGSAFELTDAAYPDWPWAIAMAKNRGTMSHAVQGALAELVSSGVYRKVLDKYGIGDAALTPAQVTINGAGTEAFPLDK